MTSCSPPWFGSISNFSDRLIKHSVSMVIVSLVFHIIFYVIIIFSISNSIKFSTPLALLVIVIYMVILNIGIAGYEKWRGCTGIN